MTRRVIGLSQTAQPVQEISDGVYLVRIQRVKYHWDKTKPYYDVQFAVLLPVPLAGRAIASRLYVTEKAMWKLAWFLRDFGYDAELLGRDELDEKRLVGLTGVVKISHRTVSGRTYLNLDAFAKAGDWDELSLGAPISDRGPEPEAA